MPSSRGIAVTVLPEESTSAIASRLNSSVYRFVYLLPTWCYFLWNLRSQSPGVHDQGEASHTTPPPAWATSDALSAAVSLAVKSARLTIASDAIGERVIAWGGRYKVDPITALGDGELTDARVAEYTDAKVAGYVAKYATKNAEGTGTVDRTLMCRPCAGRGYVRGPDGFHDGRGRPLRTRSRDSRVHNPRRCGAVVLPPLYQGHRPLAQPRPAHHLT
ncbi:replication initiator [Streptomyces dysideae]|uniref:replication initiator n=1 Tax=Streptomyces dysideae TaxID=909626 RepID=UPI002D21CCBB|nr:replication initiator [Streptomyces dysideae]